MRYTNLHTHTTFSDGAHTIAENIASAVEKNMLSLGFSDHSFTPKDPLYCMRKERYGEYIDALETFAARSLSYSAIMAGKSCFKVEST